MCYPPRADRHVLYIDDPRMPARWFFCPSSLTPDIANECADNYMINLPLNGNDRKDTYTHENHESVYVRFKNVAHTILNNRMRMLVFTSKVRACVVFDTKS